MQTSDEAKKAVEVVFKANADFYKTRGFQRRVGQGKKPALLIIDLANACTRPGNAFTCDNMEEIIPANQKLLEAYPRCNLNLGKRYRETVFNFAKHREPEAYRLIIERKGAIPPPEN